MNDWSTHFIPMRLLGIWRRVFCRKGWHAYDEVMSGDENYLSCDACGFVVNIESKETEYAETRDGWEGF